MPADEDFCALLKESSVMRLSGFGVLLQHATNVAHSLEISFRMRVRGFLKESYANEG